MIKKIGKLCIFAMISFFVSTISSFAFNVKVEELGKAIDTVNSKTSTVYVIGKYAFTSSHILKTQDVMLAATSIELDPDDGAKGPGPNGEKADPAYEKMAIFIIKREVTDEGVVTGKWVASKNLVGSANVPDELDIQFVDYVEIEEPVAPKSESDADIYFDLNSISEENKALYNAALASVYNFTANSSTINIADGNITGSIEKYNDITGFEGTDKTGYYVSFVLEIDDEYVDTATFKLIGSKEKSFKFSEVKDTNNGVAVVMALNPKLDSAQRKFTVVVDLDGDGEDFEPKEYTYSYSDLEFIEPELASINFDLNSISEENKSLYNAALASTFNFTANSDTINIADGSITGTMERNDDIIGFDGEDATGYYVGFVLEIDDEYVDTATFKLIGAKEKLFKFSEVKDTDNGVAIVMALQPEKSSSEQKFTVEVALNGESDDNILTYEFDYSGVVFN